MQSFLHQPELITNRLRGEMVLPMAVNSTFTPFSRTMTPLGPTLIEWRRGEDEPPEIMHFPYELGADKTVPNFPAP